MPKNACVVLLVNTLKLMMTKKSTKVKKQPQVDRPLRLEQITSKLQLPAHHVDHVAALVDHMAATKEL